jgi:hypothetical protein
MARKKIQRNYYAELAAYLNPQSHADGALQVDAVIVDGLRYRAKRYNWRLLIERLGMICACGSTILAVLPYEMAWIGVKEWPIPGIAWQYGVIGVVVGIMMIALGYRDMFTEDPPYHPPPVIADWLRNQGDGQNMRYWHEIYWPWVKLDAHRVRVWFFTFWRDAPRKVIADRGGMVPAGMV